MDEEAALIAAIAESPADDLPRLVYADWLDEQNRTEYADYIRTQCTLAREPIDSPAWIVHRKNFTWKATPAAWLPAPPKLPSGLSWHTSPYRRGFPNRLMCNANNGWNGEQIPKYADQFDINLPHDEQVIDVLWQIEQVPAIRRFMFRWCDLTQSLCLALAQRHATNPIVELTCTSPYLEYHNHDLFRMLSSIPSLRIRVARERDDFLWPLNNLKDSLLRSLVIQTAETSPKTLSGIKGAIQRWNPSISITE